MANDSIACPVCGSVSYHPTDISTRYCGACHKFHSQMGVKFCACGGPLHYSDPHNRELVERQIAELGECVSVINIATKRTFMVPRHFIALHGIKAGELPELAERYGFEEVR